jgi:hypothetical protein
MATLTLARQKQKQDVFLFPEANILKNEVFLFKKNTNLSLEASGNVIDIL